MQDDDLLLQSPPAVVDQTLAEMHDLGVDRVRLSVIWHDVAPAAPVSGDAYPAAGLAPLDTAVQEAAAHGIEVLLNVRGPAPAWALPRHVPARFAGRGGYEPDPNRFRLFVQMLGKRYPQVHAWSVWNEPNWGAQLQPQSVRVRHRLVTVAPRLYRRLFRAATGALRATGHGADTILLGETAPIGAPNLGQLAAIKPLRFLRDLFCLDGRLRPLRGRAARALACDYDRRGPLMATGYAHHPYAVTAPPWQPSANPDDVTLADLPRLYRVLNAAARAHRLPRRQPVWLTEFGYQTAPPDPYRGVTLDEQAAWLVAAEHQTWADPHVAALTQFLLRDSPPDTLYPASDRRYWGTYQTGLRFADGSPKPAYDAYRLPLMAPDGLTPGAPLTLWGMVRPGANGVAQHVRLQFRPAGGDWSDVGALDVTDPHGYFQTTLPAAQAGDYRFEWVRPSSSAPAGSGSSLLAVR
jgi:hypothetical protein